MNEVLLTPEGLSRLEGELERLVTIERAAVAARQKGRFPLVHPPSALPHSGRV